MPKTTVTLLSLTLALTALAAAGCDAPIDHDDAEALEIPADAFVIGAIEADDLDPAALQALALAAAAEDAEITEDPSLAPSATLAAGALDPVAICNNGWWWKCCFYDEMTCCANRIGSYYCEY